MLQKNAENRKESRTLDRIKAGELLSKETRGNIPIIGWIEGPLAEACDLAGVENILFSALQHQIGRASCRERV